MKEMWEDRYSGETYAYGTEPNAFFRKVLDTLKPGGKLIIESFSVRQLRYASGGLRDEGLLYSPDDLRSDFSGLEIISLSEQDVALSEGPFRQGKASVVKMIAHKNT
jgi:hypothetical protein